MMTTEEQLDMAERLGCEVKDLPDIILTDFLSDRFVYTKGKDEERFSFKIKNGCSLNK